MNNDSNSDQLGDPGVSSLSGQNPTPLEQVKIVNPTEARPRIWTCFLVLFVVFVCFVGSYIVGAFFMMITLLASGVPQNDLMSAAIEESLKPTWFIGLGALGQLTLLFGALAAAKLSRQTYSKRLRLKSPSIAIWQYGLFGVATFLPAGIGILGAFALTFLVPADQSMEQALQNLSPITSVIFVLFVSLAPGFSEEFLFRGYVQSRLLKRWNPWLAILFSSAVFGMFHLLPHTIVFASILGVWLGYLAWKTDSIWPSIFCHVFYNGMAMTLNLLTIKYEAEDSISIAIMAGAAALGLIAFIFSIIVLNQHSHRHQLPEIA